LRKKGETRSGAARGRVTRISVETREGEHQFRKKKDLAGGGRKTGSPGRIWRLTLHVLAEEKDLTKKKKRRLG